MDKHGWAACVHAAAPEGLVPAPEVEAAADEAAGAPNKDGVGPVAAAELPGKLNDRGLPAQAKVVRALQWV